MNVKFFRAYFVNKFCKHLRIVLLKKQSVNTMLNQLFERFKIRCNYCFTKVHGKEKDTTLINILVRKHYCIAQRK